jgi:hypothetical protein
MASHIWLCYALLGQESFWLGETLKYFYLIFAPRNTVNLEDFWTLYL